MFGKILHQELVKKENKYNYFELNVIDFEDKKSGILVIHFVFLLASLT